MPIRRPPSSRRNTGIANWARLSLNISLSRFSLTLLLLSRCLSPAFVFSMSLNFCFLFSPVFSLSDTCTRLSLPPKIHTAYVPHDMCVVTSKARPHRFVVKRGVVGKPRFYTHFPFSKPPEGFDAPQPIRRGCVAVRRCAFGPRWPAFLGQRIVYSRECPRHS